MKYSVYGTVYNNAASVESAIRSVFRPEYEVVLVDSNSTDGTYERLLQLRQDFNLTILRVKSSRGKGRDHALRHCQDSAMTAYIDLDCEYNENFHRLMLSETPGLVVNVGQGTYFMKKEQAVKNGGWKDMNSAEDIDFILRNGIAHTVSAVVGYNQPASLSRERRYSRGLGYYMRVAGKTVDRIRGDGLRYSEVNPTSVGIESSGLLTGGWRGCLISKCLYLVAASKGISRYDVSVNNRELFRRAMLSTMEDPARFGISDHDIIFPFKQTAGRNAPDGLLAERWRSGYKFACESDWVLYVKSVEALKHLERMPEYGCRSPSQIGRIGA